MLYGNYASPRDAGNFAAGMIAQNSGLEPLVQFGFSAYNLSGNNALTTGLITAGQAIFVLLNPAVGLTTSQLISLFGEDKLSQRSIDLGKQHIKRQ